MTDADLLRRYVADRSESAFAALVHRHVDLVYSVALRHVRSPQLAEDVAQSVFVDLARQAPRIKRGTPLVAWLHVVARRAAIDAVRADSRRRARETAAAALAPASPETMNSTPGWPALEPLLDEAVGSLKQADRTAVLLRFFENKSLREVGDALGTSDDAAQKRVTRALDQLRHFLHRRGVVVTSAGLATGLSAHAIQSAPAALAPSLSSVAFAQTSVALTLSHSAQVLAMTATQKFLVVTLLTAALGASLFETKIISNQRKSVATLQAQVDTYERELASFYREREEANRKLSALSGELATAKAQAAKFAAADPAVEEALDEWLHKVVHLKQELKQRPELQIPELQFLETKDWLDATKEHAIESEMDIRAALSALRQSGKLRVFSLIGPALIKYSESTGRKTLTDFAQLIPYLEKPIDPAVWRRYEIVPTEKFDSSAPHFKGADGKRVEFMIQESNYVDDYFDSKFFASLAGWGYSVQPEHNRELNSAIDTFRAAHGGKRPTDPTQVTPYLKEPLDPAFVRRFVHP